MNDIEYRIPSDSKEFQAYDLFRWKILRKPIGKSIESLKDEFEDLAFHLIGVKNNKIVSCGRLHFNNEDEAQIRYMAVEEGLQGNGLGKKILFLLEKKAQEKNAKKIILNARDHVIRFYEKSGYKILKKFNGSDTGIPHTTMEKNI